MSKSSFIVEPSELVFIIPEGLAKNKRRERISV